MVIQSWIIGGLIAGCLVGLVTARGCGIVGDILFAILGGLLGGSLASILFVISGAVNGANVIAAIIAFTCAAILFAMKRVIVRPRGLSA